MSAWILVSPVLANDLRAQLSWILDFIEPRLSVLLELSLTCEIDIFCGFSSENGQGGCTFDHAVLERLGKIPFSLTLDLYPPLSSSQNEYGIWDDVSG